MRIPGRTIESFGAGVPAAEGEWGLVHFDGTTWLAHGGDLLRPDVGAVAGRPPQRAERAGGAGARVHGHAHHRAMCSTRCKSFQGLPHRMQTIAESGRVVYIDDSKATTIVATQAALDGIERPAVLIAGGDGKGQDFRPLKSSVDADCRAVLLIGRDAPLIARVLEGTPARVEMVGTLDAAIDARVCAGRAWRRGAAVAGMREPRPVRQLHRARRALRGARARAS